MVVTMAIKIGGMTGLTGLTRSLARGITDTESGSIAMTGLTSQLAMGLAGSGIGRRGGGGMTADTQGDRGHYMVMAMAIEVGTMTGLTAGPGGLSLGAAGQCTIAGMAGSASQQTVGLTSVGIRRLGGGGMTVGAHGYRAHGVAMTMTAEEVTMTGLTRSTASRHGRGLTVRGQQAAVGGVMAGGTGIMHLVVGRGHGYASGSTGNGPGGVARITVGGSGDAGRMVGIAMARKVRTMTDVTVTPTRGHDRSLPIGGPQSAVGCMTGGTGIVHLVVSGIDRCAG